MDGFELRRQIKKIDNVVKVCFVTASELYYEEFRKELRLEEEPIIDKDRYLRKPIQNEELIAEITRIINSD
jgi:CheY-like chemotaxis protein